MADKTTTGAVFREYPRFCIRKDGVYCKPLMLLSSEWRSARLNAHSMAIDKSLIGLMLKTACLSYMLRNA